MISLKRMLLAIAVVTVFASVALAARGGTGDPFGDRVSKDVYTNGAKGDYLAGFHIKGGLTADCTTCHGDKPSVDDSEGVINAKCVECHGTYKELGDQAKKADPKAISAHSGHLVDPSCTSCHAGHVTSFPYCNNCHIFPMKIAFARQKVPYVPEDLTLYKNTVPNRVEKTDIVVIGAGGSGMVAAMEIANSGKKVILLEKMPILGGSSLLSTGGLNATGTKLQKENGVKDSVDLFIKDTLWVGKGSNDKELVKVLAEKSASAVDWFLNKGGELSLDMALYGGTSAPRMHFTKSGGIGRYMSAVLAKELNKSSADIRLNSKAVRINADKNGRVTGVLVQGKTTGLYEIKADAVILATGSYANNPAIVSKYNPSFFGMVSSTQPGSHGDGITLAENVGAKIISLEKVQIHPNIAAGTSLMITLAMRTNGGILVNKEGKRFMNDNAPRNEIGVGILQQTGQTVYLIYDDAVVSKRKSVHEGYVRLGFVKEADSPEKLAELMGVPKDAFAATMKRYAEFHKNQKDADFNRKELAEPLTTGKLYAIEVIPAIGGTLGGVVIDTNTRVLDKNNKPIAGLYASGEVVGGWHGDDRYGGNAVAGNIVFGRISAENAMKLVK